MKRIKLVGWCIAIGLAGANGMFAKIDRERLVARHAPTLHEVDFGSPLTVGNGGFAFTVDVTGLQTFVNEYYQGGIPLETLSRWCWVEDENPKGFKLSDANRDYVMPDGRKQGFPTEANSPAGDWLRKNPRNHPMGQLALDWLKDDGTPFVPSDVKAIDQKLDLWRGVITSRFELGGEAVTVVTVCDPNSDTLGVKVTSALVAAKKLRLRLAFPRGHDPAVKNTPGFDWSHPETHRSMLNGDSLIERRVGATRYFVRTDRTFQSGKAVHEFFVAPVAGNAELSMSLSFSPLESAALPSFQAIEQQSVQAWGEFWSDSAVLDLEGSTNPLADKLENRVVLSQYLTAVQMAGDVPPQESGLTCSTWYGKHHTEMIWWHTAHFALWNQKALLEKNLRWYQARLPEARAIAQSRSLRGARWPKMVGPDARESPGGNPMIVWNQPHLIYLAELLYRADPRPETVATYASLVEETAECLASMMTLDAATNRYVLGPPLWIVQEIYDPATSQNPAFELAYWRWTLELAQTWRERQGKVREKSWDDICARIAPLPTRAGKYVALESQPDTWENRESRHDHPEMLMAWGVMPKTESVDRATMEKTLDAVLEKWDWETKIWGWDYPMIAMTAVRLGRPALAMEVLLRDGPNNRYTRAGHCPQRSDVAGKAAGKTRAEIAVYLPANGAFLSAVALMVAGWDGNAEKFPGFAKDGSWTIQAEGWSPLP